MAEDPRFILHFKTLAKFKQKLADGTVSENRHLVFIKDEKLLWCRGIYYSDASKLDNFNSYYNDWLVDQSNASTLSITLKGNQWNSTSRAWEAISKKLTLNSATGTISGLMSAQDKRQLDIIDTANFQLEDPTTNATTVTINASHTDVNGETRDQKTSKNLTSATASKAGILTAQDKRQLDIISTANYELTAPTTTATNVILHSKRTDVNAETAVTDPETETVRTLPAVTESKAGVMIATDKIAINNLIKLKNFSHLDDDNLFTRTANNVNINYSCRATDNNTSYNNTTHSIGIGAATSSLAGVMTATDKTELDRISTANFALGAVTPATNKITITANKTNISNNTSVDNTITIPVATREKAGLVTNIEKQYLDAINTIGDISNLTSITTDTVNAYLNYKDVNKVGQSTSTKKLTIPTATTDKAGVITNTEKRKLNQISYTDGDTNTTAGITQINFSAGKTDTAKISSVCSNDNTKLIVDIGDNFGYVDTNDVFQVRGKNGEITPENNVRFQVGKTIQARSKNDVLERVLTTIDLTDGSVTKVGTATVGSGIKPIYLSSGTPTASSSTVGSGIKPIYMNAGTLTASSSTIGASNRPTYLSGGTITQCLTPTSGAYFQGVPYVSSDGVMETGRYIDLHPTNDSTIDYNVRIDGGNSTTARLYTFGTAGGEFVTHKANTAIGSSTSPVYVASSGVVTQCSLDDRYYTESEIDTKVNAINTTISTNKSTMDSHISNKSNPHAVTKAQVGLGNVTNESKATMFTSPAFTGTPTAPTAAKGTNTTQIATTAFVQTAAADAVTKIVAGAGESFDTLKEISDWIGTHSNSAAAMNTQINTNKTNISNIQTKLDGIASGAEVNVQSDWNVNNTASDAYIKNKPTSMPASDVYAWAKASTKPSYSWSEITNKPTFATVATSGSYSDLSNKPTAATSSKDGFMSSTDKAKLDGIATGANKYELPKASSTVLGGVKVGTNLSIDASGKLSATDTKYSNASTTAAGLMSKEDKIKLDGIANSANNYSLPVATSSARGGVKIGYTSTGKNYAVQLSNEQMYVNVPWQNTTYSNATTATAGLMSATDKTKLDGIATGANKYSLPTASSSTLGGIKVGTNLSISNGVLSATNTTYSVATTTTNGLMSSSDKAKLDGIASNANKYTLPTASSSTLGGIKVSGNGLYMNNRYLCVYECNVLSNNGYLTDFTTTDIGNLNDSIGSSKGVITNWQYNCLMRTMATFHTNTDFNLGSWMVSDTSTLSCNNATGYQFLIPSLRGRYHKGTPANNEFQYQFSILPPNCALGLKGPYISYINQADSSGSGSFTCLKIDTTNGNIHIPHMIAKSSGKLYFKDEQVVVGAATETQIGGIKMWKGTKAQYDAIETKQSDCLYLITE